VTHFTFGEADRSRPDDHELAALLWYGVRQAAPWRISVGSWSSPLSDGKTFREEIDTDSRTHATVGTARRGFAGTVTQPTRTHFVSGAARWRVLRLQQSTRASLV